MGTSNLPWVINFANSIVGVGVLAIPFCFYKCGIIMAISLILASNFCTKRTCIFLLKSAQKAKTSGYESLASYVIGPMGKLLTELCTIGLLLGTLVAFQVVVGDLAPTIVHSVTGVQLSWNLRAFLMCLSCVAIVPLSLMRNISSLAGMNAMSMGFYCIFILLIGTMSLSNLFFTRWWTRVNFWQPAGFFHCLPIISLAFSCQTEKAFPSWKVYCVLYLNQMRQVFVMYEALPEPSVKAMNDIVDKAINLVTFIYISVGFLGYVAFSNVHIHGDILANFSPGLMTDSVKAGFWLSVVISFPLIIFPVRLAIYSLVFKRKENADVISSALDYIPRDLFTVITLVLVGGTLIVGITTPHVETVLSVTGACIGTFLCFVLPPWIYLAVMDEGDRHKTIAKVILVLSLLSMVASTVTVLSGTGSDASHEVNGLQNIKGIGVDGNVVHLGQLSKRKDEIVSKQTKVSELQTFKNLPIVTTPSLINKPTFPEGNLDTRPSGPIGTVTFTQPSFKASTKAISVRRDVPEIDHSNEGDAAIEERVEDGSFSTLVKARKVKTIELAEGRQLNMSNSVLVVTKQASEKENAGRKTITPVVSKTKRKSKWELKALLRPEERHNSKHLENNESLKLSKDMLLKGSINAERPKSRLLKKHKKAPP